MFLKILCSVVLSFSAVVHANDGKDPCEKKLAAPGSARLTHDRLVEGYETLSSRIQNIPNEVLSIFSHPESPKPLTLNLYFATKEDFDFYQAKISLPQFKSLQSVVMDDNLEPYIVVLRGDSATISQVLYGFKESTPGATAVELAPEIEQTIPPLNYSKLDPFSIDELEEAWLEKQFSFFIFLHDGFNSNVLSSVKGLNISANRGTLMTARGSKKQIHLLLALPEVKMIHLSKPLKAIHR